MRRIMSSRVFLAVIVVVLGLSANVMSRQSAGDSTVGEIVKLDGRLDALIEPGVKIELLATGFEWSEGPLWIQDPGGGYLLFSDIPRNSVMKWKEGGRVSVFMKPSGYT
ncbi:MAG: hypothetical protein JSU70_06260, partial [Phycisphaerales bacterium]